MLEDICSVRIQRVKELPAEIDLATSTVARRSGFSNAERMAVIFRPIVGMTPGPYRRRAGSRG